MIDKYIRDNGRLDRGRIAFDIIHRKIDRNAIEELVKYPEVISSFVDMGISYREPQNKWNKEYLNKLFDLSAIECFNRDFLLYLDEVAEYVNKSSSKKSSVKKGILGLIVIAVIIIIIIIIRGK